MRGYQMQGEGGRVFEDERAARVDRAAGGQSTTCAPNVRRCLHFAGKLINAFTVRRYFFDWLVDLAYRLAGASRLVLIHSSAPDSLSYRFAITDQ